MTDKIYSTGHKEQNRSLTIEDIKEFRKEASGYVSTTHIITKSNYEKLVRFLLTNFTEWDVKVVKKELLPYQYRTHKDVAPLMVMLTISK